MLSAPTTLGVKRTEGADLVLVLASVQVTSLAPESEGVEMTVVACVVEDRSEDSETDSVSGSVSG
jgi:hypothetical protein